VLRKGKEEGGEHFENEHIHLSLGRGKRRRNRSRRRRSVHFSRNDSANFDAEIVLKGKKNKEREKKKRRKNPMNCCFLRCCLSKSVSDKPSPRASARRRKEKKKGEEGETRQFGRRVGQEAPPQHTAIFARDRGGEERGARESGGKASFFRFLSRCLLSVTPEIEEKGGGKK